MNIDQESLERKTILSYVDFMGKDVLEIGCGDGRLTVLFSEFAKKVVALDPDKESIKSAKDNNARKNVSYQLGSGEGLSALEDNFDVIIFTFSLHHQDSAKALEEAFKKLKDDGELLVIEPTNIGEVQEIFNVFEDETKETEEAIKAIEGSNFKLIKTGDFVTKWRAENMSIIYDFFFDYYDKEPEEVIKKKIDNIVSVKKVDSPIILENINTIYKLKKAL